jgi:antitoxin MazE
MKARLIRIGNSRGVRLPRPLIEEAGLADEVELQAREGEIVIRRVKSAREGWAEAARRLREQGEDELLDAPAPTRFDETEWEW